MPKRRNTTLLSGSGAGSGLDDLEIQERINARLRNAGGIVVDVPSRRRGDNENVVVTFNENGTAGIRSQSGNIYTVNPSEGTCTCPDYEHRSRRCRHIQAVDIAINRIGQDYISGSRQNIEIENTGLIEEHRQQEREGERINANRFFKDDDFFYTENPDMFEEDMERLRYAPVPYYRENAINGGADLTFGIELEFVNGDSNAIVQELYQMGLCNSSHMEKYHRRGRDSSKWVVERDSSVTSGNRGGEIVSPILRDTPEAWNQIEKICEVAKRHGATVNYKTGAHVHIGAETPLDDKKQRWRRFFKSAAGFEETLYRLSGGEQGGFRGGGYPGSSTEQMSRAARMRIATDEMADNFLRRIADRRYSSINLLPFMSSKRTVEFRAFNGTLTPGIIQANVKFAAGMILTSERSREKDSEGLPAPTASDKKRSRIIKIIQRTTRAPMKA